MSNRTDSSALLPARTGVRPNFCGIPHVQLDQLPLPKLIEDLAAASRSLPHVRFRESRMAGPETSALCVADEIAFGPSLAFIDDHEFCHLHPPPGGSIHLTLPHLVRERIVEL